MKLNKKIIVWQSCLVCFIVLLFSFHNSGKTSSSTQLSDDELFIDSLINNMTLQQKVGQMTQINLDLVSKGEIYKLKKPHEIDPEKLKIAINKYFVGSVLNAPGYPISRDHWKKVITTIQKKSINEGAKIPIIYGIDAVHGANYTVDATLFPQQIGLAATWNPQLVEDVASITAYEVSSCGIHWNFSPVLDLGRQPLWGRFYETFGEDVLLNKSMGTAFVKGYQGNTIDSKYKVASCLKHYVGYSLPLSGKDRTPAWIPERALREYFLPAFEAAINEGALSIMVNSGEVNGIPVHANKRLLTEILRNELKFEGVVLTDWEDIIKLYKDHHVARDMKEAVLIAINAGIDMSMTPNDFSFNDALLELVKDGYIKEKRIDQSVKRILKMKQKLGLFKNPIPDYDGFENFGSKKFKEKSLEAAQESITLVKNTNQILPLKKSAKILLTGPGANSINYLNGGWTYTWQGDDTQYNPENKLTIKNALSKLSNNITFKQGVNLNSDINTSEVVEEAKTNDVIIVCLSEDPAAEGPADINSLDFPESQKNLVKELSKTKKPIIIVSTTSRPRLMREIEPLAEAILIGYLPSNEGGEAIANTLFGKNNPSGKLPFTYPKYQGLNVCYDYKHTEKKDRFLGQTSSLSNHDRKFKGSSTQWDFGFGLSYSNFEYSNLSINKNVYGLNDTIELQVSIQNNSRFKGKEVIQVYCSDLVASITPSVKRLRAFKKVELKENEKRKFQLRIPIKDLSFVNFENKWTVEKGKFRITIQNLEEEFEVSFSNGN